MTQLRVAAKAVIYNQNGEVLLLREASYDGGTNTGKWVVPGGGILRDENLETGLTREVFEETGLTITKERVVHADEWFPRDTHTVGIFFKCRTEGSVVQLSKEHDMHVWVRIDNVDTYEILEQDRIAIDASI